MSACAALILVVPDYPLLLAVLALFGFSMATLDVAMNAEASAVEIAIGRPIMSSLHGMFSIGGMAGAAAGGALLSAGMAPAVHLALAAATSATVLVVASPAVLPHVPHHEHAHGGGNRWRSPALWMLGGIALVALIAEGAMYDWATVYMRDVVVAAPRSPAPPMPRSRAGWPSRASRATPCAPASARRSSCSRARRSPARG